MLTFFDFRLTFMWGSFLKTKYNGSLKMSEAPPGSRSEGGIWSILAIFFWNRRNSLTILWNFPEFSKNVWNFLEFSKNRLDFFGIFKKKCLKMFWNCFATEQSPLPHDGAERPRRHSKKAPTSTFLGSKQRQKVARVATSGAEIDQNSEKRFFLIFKDFKIFIAREARTP